GHALAELRPNGRRVGGDGDRAASQREAANSRAVLGCPSPRHAERRCVRAAGMGERGALGHSPVNDATSLLAIVGGFGGQLADWLGAGATAVRPPMGWTADCD